MNKTGRSIQKQKEKGTLERNAYIQWLHFKRGKSGAELGRMYPHEDGTPRSREWARKILLLPVEE